MIIINTSTIISQITSQNLKKNWDFGGWVKGGGGSAAQILQF
jgi:hypothetical protein